MSSRFQRIVLVCFLVGFGGDVSNAGDSGKPAASIEVADFEEVAGILAWSFRLPEGIAADEYARLEWNILPDGEAGRVEPGGIDFSALSSNGEIKLFLWVEAIRGGNPAGIQAIRYCVKTRGIDGRREETKGRLQLPAGYTQLYGFEKSGPSDLNGFVMLNSPTHGKGLAHLNLGYTSREKD
ncbi:MAG: hypothetical protein P1U86_14135 [Verrucomicrobiales bacterium]|nr:hypothetical protein [Verrucomicrobiales bacterium]